MSTVEARPVFVTGESGPPAAVVLRPRLVPLGGPRAMTVRRTLPQRARSLIGAWCFVDHYGPDEVSATGGMLVAGHPHTGLQTVSWLFAGEIEHRDTVGTVSAVRPGEVNLMTAGRGIAHSEFSTAATSVLHGAQLWIALPERERDCAPRFEHYVPEPLAVGGARLSVFIGSLMGSTSPVRTATPLVGAEIRLDAGARVTLDVDPAFEHGVLADTGAVRVAGSAASGSAVSGSTASGSAVAGSTVSGTAVAGSTVEPAELLFVPAGPGTLTIEAGPEPTRLLLLGGEPLGERIVMWWNFIGRTHEEIVEFRARWQAQGFGEGDAPAGEPPYGPFPADWDTVLPAPPLPNARLRPRT